LARAKAAIGQQPLLADSSPLLRTPSYSVNMTAVKKVGFAMRASGARLLRSDRMQTAEQQTLDG